MCVMTLCVRGLIGMRVLMHAFECVRTTLWVCMC